MTRTVLRIKSLFDPGLLLRHSIIILAANLSGSVLGFAYQVFLARKLGAADYGAFGVLFSIIVFLFIVTGAIQTTLSKFITESEGRPDQGRTGSILRQGLVRSLVLGLLVAIPMVLLSGYIAPLLQFSQALPLIIVWLSLIPIFALSALRGGLQGLQKYYQLGSVRLVEASSGLLLGVVLVLSGFGLSGAITGTASGMTFATIAGFCFLRRSLSSGQRKAKMERQYRYFFEVMAVLVPMTALTTTDIILVKFYFAPDLAGQYIAAAVIAKILSLAAVAISTAMFPKTTGDFAGRGSTSGFLVRASLYMVVLSLVFLIVSFFFGKPIINLVYGSEYNQTIGLLPRLGLALSFYSVGYIIAFYNLSRSKKRQWIWMTSVAVAQAVLIAGFHGSLETVTNIGIGVMALFLVINWVSSRRLAPYKN